jgi:polyhydroxyalkanoate synthesis regulator phasin
MKSLVMKSIYAGLGLLGTGKQSVEHLGRELAKRANLSEKEGEKVARQLKHHSEKAIGSLQKSLNAEVNKVVKAIHSVTATKAKSKPKTKTKSKHHSARRTKSASSH